MLEGYRLRAAGPIEFKHAGTQSDLDLIVVDTIGKFGVAFQLKWLKAPDNVRDREYDDRELRRGVDQASLALDWLRSGASGLSGCLGWNDKTLSTLEYGAMVLSKNTFGSASLGTDVPVVNEPLLHYVLGEPHKKSLRSLYRVASERRYLPKPDVHFVWKDEVATFGGIQFVGERVGAELLRRWDPSTDIDVSGLE
jgi:hypothetical protein